MRNISDFGENTVFLWYTPRPKPSSDKKSPKVSLYVKLNVFLSSHGGRASRFIIPSHSSESHPPTEIHIRSEKDVVIDYII